MFVFFFFFFKQKTAYEMRISDWSSDVCSSDLLIAHPRQEGGLGLVGRLQRLVAFAQRAFHFPARRNVEHDEQRIAVGQRDRREIEIWAISETDFAAVLLPFHCRGADHLLQDADLRSEDHTSAIESIMTTSSA